MRCDITREEIESIYKEGTDAVIELVEEKDPYSFRALCPIRPNLWAVAIYYPEKTELFFLRIEDKTIKKEEKPIEIPTGKVHSLTYLPEENAFLIGYLTKLVFFSLEEKEVKQEIETSIVYIIIPFLDNSFIAQIGYKTIYFPNPKDLENRKEVNLNREGAYAIRPTIEKGIFYNNYEILYFKKTPESEEEIKIGENEYASITGISNYLSKDKMLAIGDYKGNIRLVFFDPETGEKEFKEIPSEKIHYGPIRWLHLTTKEDNTYIFSASDDGTLKLTKFDLQGNVISEPKILINAEYPIFIFFFDFQGNLIAIDLKGKVYFLPTKES